MPTHNIAPTLNLQNLCVIGGDEYSYWCLQQLENLKVVFLAIFSSITFDSWTTQVELHGSASMSIFFPTKRTNYKNVFVGYKTLVFLQAGSAGFCRADYRTSVCEDFITRGVPGTNLPCILRDGYSFTFKYKCLIGLS